MMHLPRDLAVALRGPTLCAVLLLSLAACGSASSASHSPEATAAPAAGDIPDTATYLTYRGAGYAVKYVEGWSILLGPGAGVTMSDKDSSESVRIVRLHAQTPRAFAARDIARLPGAVAHFRLVNHRSVALSAGRSRYIQYRTLSRPDPVTGKQVPVSVDRYYIPGAGTEAILTLSTPLGVDNVDAFRLIARSFRWR